MEELRREYKYENAIVELIFPDEFDEDKFRKSTKQFLKRVMKEKSSNDNSNTSEVIRKK